MPATAGTPIGLPPRLTTGKEQSDYRLTLEWLVVLSEPDATNGATIARNASGIPADGSFLSGSTTVRCLRVTAEPVGGDEHGINYKVSAEYGFDSSSGSGSEPWTNKDRIRRTVQNYTIYRANDLDGTPIKTSAEEPIAGGLAFDEFNPVYIVNRFRRMVDFNPEAAMDCVGTVNENDVTLNPLRGVLSIYAEEGLLRSFTCDEKVWSDGTTYYDMTFEIEVERQVPLLKYYVANKGRLVYDNDTGSAFKPYVLKDPVTGIKTNPEVYIDTNGDPKPTYQGMQTSLAGTRFTKNDDLEFTRRLVKDWSGWAT